MRERRNSLFILATDDKGTNDAIQWNIDKKNMVVRMLPAVMPGG
jgi:hypothetical protein